MSVLTVYLTSRAKNNCTYKNLKIYTHKNIFENSISHYILSKNKSVDVTFLDSSATTSSFRLAAGEQHHQESICLASPLTSG